MRNPARVVAVALALVVSLGLLPSAEAAKPRSPDSWSGLAFDACQAPSQRAMDAWWFASPYSGVGVYIGGAMRACSQPHLTRSWVQSQTSRGWKLLPIWVGPQASCSGFSHRISSVAGRAGRYPGAQAQGLRAARGAVAAARQLGVVPGTTLWYDLEYFPVRNTRCRQASLRLLSAWTLGVRRAGFRSGVYSSVSAAIDALDTAARTYRQPDRIWFAWANGRPDAKIDSKWVHPTYKTYQRVHQYRLDHVASYGGVRMAIDSNYVRLDKHPEGVREPAGCGRAANRKTYSKLHRGSRGRQVVVVRCLLEQPRSGHPFGVELLAGVLDFQQRHNMWETGRVDRRTWTALLSSGSRQVVKRGSTGEAVRRLQRALNAALAKGPRITGYFGPGTTDAVKRYQRRVHHRPTGVVVHRTWMALARGRVGITYKDALDVHSHVKKAHHKKAHQKAHQKNGHGKHALKHGHHKKLHHKHPHRKHSHHSQKGKKRAQVRALPRSPEPALGLRFIPHQIP